MLDQAFHTAEARRPRKDFRFCRDVYCSIAIALYFQRKHSAEHRHLLSRNLVTGMRNQPRKMHALHLSMSREKIGDLRSVLAMRAHSPRQRAHAAQYQPAIKRRG